MTSPCPIDGDVTPVAIMAAMGMCAIVRAMARMGGHWGVTMCMRTMMVIMAIVILFIGVVVMIVMMGGVMRGM